MSVFKFIARNAPYIEATFASLIDGLYGSSRMLTGGVIIVTSPTTVSVSPYTFIQSGLVVIDTDGHPTVIVPSYASEKRPIYLIVGSPDATLASGVVCTATTALYATTGVVIAVRTNGVWISSPSASVTSADDQSRLVEKTIGSGVVSGLVPRILTSGVDGATGVGVQVGQALTSQGLTQLTAGIAAGTAADEHAEFPNGVQDPYWSKTNYYLLRRGGAIRAGGPALAVAPGDSLSAVGAIVDAGVVSSANVVRQSDGVTGVAWTKGSVLYYATYSLNQVRILSPVTVFTSGGAFDGNRDLWAAQRSDGALVIAFCDTAGAQRVLKIVSINFDTGVAVPGDGGVKTISSQPNQVRAPRFVIDSTDTMHAVAQHNEASPNNQVYYFRVGAAAGSGFGSLLSSTPRIVGGTNDGGNDTNPSIAVDAFRNLTVAYAKGTGANVYGDIIVALLDSNGNTLSTTVVSTSATTASGGASAGYNTSVTLARSAYPRAVVTPQGDTYVIFAAGTANLQNLFLYSPTFMTRLGARCIDLFQTNAADIQWLELIADELGVLRAYSTVTTPGASIQALRLDTVVAPQSVLGPSVLDSFAAVYAAGNRFTVSLNPGGSARLCLFDSGVSTLQMATISGGKNGIFTPHPLDSILGAWILQPLVTGAPSASVIRPQRTRPARFNNPVQVGRDGDFIGFDSLAAAIDTALGSGLTVRLMPGLHDLFPGSFVGGIEIDGCPGAVVAVNSTNFQPVYLGGLGGITAAASPANDVVDVSSTMGTQPIYPGDVLLLPPGDYPPVLDPPYYYVTEVDNATRLRVFNNTGAPVATPAWALAMSSVRFRGVRFVDTTGSSMIQLNYLWDMRVEDCAFDGVSLVFNNVENGEFRKNRMNGGQARFTFVNRMSVVDNESMNCTSLAANDGAISFELCSRLRVNGNRSSDHGAGVLGYKVAYCTTNLGWGSNVGTVITDDPGLLVSNNEIVTASEIFAKDIRVERLNGGSYDMRLAAIAAEIDSLKQNQPPMLAPGGFAQFNFDTKAQFFWS